MIIAAMKRILKMGIKGGKRVAKFLVNNRATRFAADTVKGLAKKMTTKKFWGRAVKVMRANLKYAGMIGKLGTALSSAGGGLGWLGKGLSAFDIDFRSPREYKQDMKAKESEMARLKKTRDDMIERELKAQKELQSSVLDVAEAETPEEKLDILAGHLDTMKKSLGKIQSDTTSTSMRLKGFEDYQVKANNALGDAITTGDQNTMKATLKGIEEVKDEAAVTQMESTSAVISEISGKLDAMEEARKEEEEHRRKNDWKRKLFEKALFIADWVLNFWWNLGIMLAKAVGIILFLLSLQLLKHWRAIKAAWTLSFKEFSYVMMMKMNKMLVRLITKVLHGLTWVVSRIGGMITGITSLIIDALLFFLKPIIGNIPLIGRKLVKDMEQGHKSIKSMTDDIRHSLENSIISWLTGFRESHDAYNDSKTNPFMRRGYENLKVQEAEEAARIAQEEKDEEERVKKKREEEGGIGTKLGKFAVGIAEDAGALVDKGKEVVDKGKEKASELAETKVGQAVVSAGTSVVETVKENVTAEKIHGAADKAISKGLQETKEMIQGVSNEIQDFKNVVNARDAAGSKGDTVVKEPEKIDFESASLQFQNQNQT